MKIITKTANARSLTSSKRDGTLNRKSRVSERVLRYYDAKGVRERERERERDEKRVTVRETTANVGQSYVCSNRTCDYHASRLLAVVGKCKIDSLRAFSMVCRARWIGFSRSKTE